jgi:hypothetical protein
MAPMLDVLLLTVAGVCQLALAYLGFRVAARPPKKPQRPILEIAFGAIGIIGFVAIVWSGIRSSTIQEATRDMTREVLDTLKGKSPDRIGRHLTPVERSAIIKSLSSTPGQQAIFVMSAASCNECEEYAEDFRSTIGSKLWKVLRNLEKFVRWKSKK